MERRPGEHQGVDVRDGHADLLIGGARQRPSGDRAVQVERAALVRAVRVDAEHDREDDRVAVHHDADVTDHRLAEDREQVGAVGERAVSVPVHLGSRRRGQGSGRRAGHPTMVRPKVADHTSQFRSI
jgi:hypothetical protein